jgi:hypothetical protein
MIVPPVGPADVNIWVETLLDNESQEFYVEIELDEVLMGVTKAVKRSDVCLGARSSHCMFDPMAHANWLMKRTPQHCK